MYIVCMVRTQIFLTPEQHRQLKRLAQLRGQTYSCILRNYLDQALGFSTQQKFLSVLRDVAGTVPMDRIKNLKRRIQGSRSFW